MNELQKRAWVGAGLSDFNRGVNFGNFLETETEGDSTGGLLIQDAWFPLLKDAGFDHVRLPVRWAGRAAEAPPYRVDNAFFDRVTRLVDEALAHGLGVVLNHHHYHELMAQPPAHRRRFTELWRAIARRFQDYPSGLVFELLNEPTAALTAPLWNEYLQEARAAVREADEKRVLAVGPAEWGNLPALERLSLSGLEGDRRMVVTFHYYEPHTFTHQGAPWVDPPRPLGARWTGTAEETAALQRDLDFALAWGAKESRPLFLGEFGVYPPYARREEIVAWTQAVREEAEARSIPWCYWEFCHDFGIWDREKKAFKDWLLRALIP